MAPEALLSAEWEYLENWLPQAREAMGDALGSTGELESDLTNLRARLLLRLAGDGQFAVRRVAFRAFTDVEPILHVYLCSSWASLKDEGAIELRSRAAEGAGWLGEDLFSEEVRSLAWDAELQVREAYARAMADRRDARGPRATSIESSRSEIQPISPQHGDTGRHSRRSGMTGRSSGLTTTGGHQTFTRPSVIGWD